MRYSQQHDNRWPDKVRLRLSIRASVCLLRTSPLPCQLSHLAAHTEMQNQRRGRATSGELLQRCTVTYYNNYNATCLCAVWDSVLGIVLQWRHAIPQEAGGVALQAFNVVRTMSYRVESLISWLITSSLQKQVIVSDVVFCVGGVTPPPKRRGEWHRCARRLVPPGECTRYL